MSKDNSKVKERKYYMSQDDQNKMDGKKRLHSIMRETVGSARKGKTAQDKHRRGIV